MSEPKNHELTETLKSAEFSGLKSNVDRLIYILGAVHGQKQKDFDEVLKITGANRTYFAKSRLEIENAGTDTAPRNIGGTPYWVLTKSSTALKRKILTQVLRKLRYSEVAVSAAIGTLG